MNILYINHYVGAPAYGMEYRPYYLAREWVRAGHQVRMLGASHSHVRARQPQPPAGLNGSRWTEQIDGIDYVWYTTPVYAGNGLGRVRNIASFLGRAALDAARTVAEFKPDVVIASSTYPMDIWLARHIARRSGAKLVFEVHDLWPLSPIELGGMSPSHPFIRLCQAAENTAYRDADLVVSMLPVVAEYTRGKGLPASRLAIVPNGMSLQEWDAVAAQPVPAEVRAVLDAAHEQGCMVMAYAGSHGVPNALDTLLDAAALLRDEPVRFVLVGDGHERERLLRRVRDEALVHVHMFPPIRKDQVPDLLQHAQGAYLGAPRQAIYRFGVSPNKMLDYMMAGVPVLYAIEAGNDPIAEADCGLTVAAENPAALADAVRALRATPAQRLAAMGENGKLYARSRHSYGVLAQAFLDAINKTTRKT